MRKVKKWRYYCEFCKKSGGSSYHMARHEERCTSNINRTCGICHTTSPRGELFAYVDSLLVSDFEDVVWHDEARRKEITSTLIDLAESCHACIFSALRIKGKFFDFGYDALRLEHWENVNDERRSIVGYTDC